MAATKSPYMSNGKHAFLDRVQAAQQSQWRKVLITGASRSGKTTLVGSAALDERTCPIVVVDFEGGSTSLYGLPADQCTVYRVKTWEDFNLVYDYLANEKHNYRSIAIDSLSETHVNSLLWIVDAELNAGQKREDPFTVYQADYGKSMVQMRRFLRAIVKLDMHCFFTALPKTENEPREGAVRKPALFGQMAEEVVGMFDVSTFLVQERISPKAQQNAGAGSALPAAKVVRKLLLQNTPGVRAGVRTPWGVRLPDYLEDPTVTKLFDLLQV